MLENERYKGLLGQEILDKIETEGIDNLKHIPGDNITFSRDKSETFKVALEAFKSEGNAEKIKKMEYEIVLFDFMMRIPSEGGSVKRFVSMIEWTNGECYPDINKITDEAKQYYKMRGEQTNNLLLKVRYCDFTWEYLKDYKHAKMAIESYLLILDYYFNAGGYIKLADCLARSLQLAIQLNDEDLIKKCVDAHIEYLSRYDKDNKYRWFFEILESIINHNQCKDYINFNKVDTYFKKAIEYSGYDVITREHLINMRIKLFKVFGKNELIRKLQEDIAEAYVSEADRRKGNSLVESMYLDKAIMHYKKINKQYGVDYTNIIDSLLIRIKHSNINSISQMQSIRSEVEIPVPEIEEFVDNFRSVTIEESLQFLAVDFPIMTPYKDAEKIVKDSLQETPLLALVTDTIIVNNNISAKIEPGEGKIKRNTQQNIILNCFFTIRVYLIPLFKMLINEKDMNSDEFMKFISSSPLFEKAKIPIIKTGVDRFFAGDYLSSIHILVFQVEGVLRNVLGKLGGSTTKVIRYNSTQEKLLDEILRDDILIQQLGNDFCYFVRTMLSDPLGENLRNRVGHALASVDEFNQANNIVLIMILLKLGILRYANLHP